MRLLEWADGFHKVSVKMPTQVQEANETHWKEMTRELPSWTKDSLSPGKAEATWGRWLDGEHQSEGRGFSLALHLLYGVRVTERSRSFGTRAPITQAVKREREVFHCACWR